jgi:hypothetical protein
MGYNQSLYTKAFCIVRALSWQLGSYPNEILLSKHRTWGFQTQTPYYYINAICGLTLVGIIIQWCMHYGKKKSLQGTT